MKGNKAFKKLNKKLNTHKITVILKDKILKAIKKDFQKISQGNSISDIKNNEFIKRFIKSCNPLNLTLNLQE